MKVAKPGTPTDVARPAQLPQRIPEIAGRDLLLSIGRGKRFVQMGAFRTRAPRNRATLFERKPVEAALAIEAPQRRGPERIEAFVSNISPALAQRNTITCASECTIRVSTD